MRCFGRLVAIGVGALLGAGPVAAMDGMVLVPSSAAVQWGPAPPSLPRGVQLSVLAGDPDKPGPFALRVRIPANVVIAPHTHATAENLTVLSGAIYHDMGETLDRGRGKHVTSGGFLYLPGEMPHSLWTAAEPAELQVVGTGPFGLKYINPADDPSRAP